MSDLSSHISELARTLSVQLETPFERTFAAVSKYYEDKLVDVWSIDNFLGVAVEEGRPITRELAMDIMDRVQSKIDPELGVTWLTLQVAIEDNCCLRLRDLPREQFGQVYGVFLIWRARDEQGLSFGSFDDPWQLGNLSRAIDQAEALAFQEPGEPVFVGCLSRRMPGRGCPSTLGVPPALVICKEPGAESVCIEDGNLFTGREGKEAIY